MSSQDDFFEWAENNYRIQEDDDTVVVNSEYLLERDLLKKGIKRIKCPTCTALIGQKDLTTNDEIISWDHAGPCGAPCAGNKYRGVRRRRSHTDALHTRHVCPRCREKDCPACKNICECGWCGGTGRSSPFPGYCVCSLKKFTPFECRHMCKRCKGVGTVHGLDAE